MTQGWKARIPACFGIVDKKFNSHPIEEREINQVIAMAEDNGDSFSDVEAELRRYLMKEGRTADHIEEQLRRIHQFRAK